MVCKCQQRPKVGGVGGVGGGGGVGFVGGVGGENLEGRCLRSGVWVG